MKRLTILTAVAGATLSLATAALADGPNYASDPDIAGLPAAEASAPPPAEAQPQRRSDLGGLLTADEAERLRLAGDQAREAGRTARVAIKDVGDRLGAQAATLAALIEQLKPTPEEQARLRALLDEQKVKLNDQLESFQRDLKAIPQSRQAF